MKKKTRYTPIQIIMHIYAWSALAHITFDYFAGNLSVNPIQDIEQRTGRAAVTLLVLSLMCTPFNTLFGWKELLKRRRALGLYTFMYACMYTSTPTHPPIPTPTLLACFQTHTWTDPYIM